MNAPPKFRPLVNTIGTILPVIAAYGVYVLCVMYSFAVVGLSLFSTCLGVLLEKVSAYAEKPIRRLPRRQRCAWRSP